MTAVLGTIEALHGFARTTIEGNRNLAKWNGQLAMAQAKADIGAIRREAHMAGAGGDRQHAGRAGIELIKGVSADCRGIAKH